MFKRKKKISKKRSFGVKRRLAKYIMPKDAKVEYKDLPLLQKYLSDRGKILSRRVTGITGRQQKELAVAVKRARYLGLLPSGSVKKR